MTQPEVQWVFDTLEGIVNGTDLEWGSVSDVAEGAVPVQRVDRNESSMYDQHRIRSRRGDLKASNFIGVGLGDRPTEPAGTTEHRTEAIVSIRIEGLHVDEWGHIDPDGVDGIPFDELHEAVRGALRDAMEYPDVNREGTSYNTAFVENETNRSSEHRDFFDYRLDVRFRGYD